MKQRREGRGCRRKKNEEEDEEERGRRGVHAWICASALPWMQLGIASMTLKGDSINGSHCRIMKKRGCCLFFSLPFFFFFYQLLRHKSMSDGNGFLWFQIRKVISLTARIKINSNSFPLFSNSFTRGINLWSNFQILKRLPVFILWYSKIQNRKICTSINNNETSTNVTNFFRQFYFNLTDIRI